jgi:glycerate-2-kinase
VQEINTVRRTLSLVKGGGLARIASPARTIGFVLSDVVGDPLSAVASGPTVLQTKNPGEARRVLAKYGLWDEAPAAIRAALDSPLLASPPPARTPTPINVLVGGNRDMVRAAHEEARRRGLRARLVTGRMQGEAREVGTKFARRLIRAPSGSCLLMGGETTVTVGLKGGRTRSWRLRCVGSMACTRLCRLASDGIDGPMVRRAPWSTTPRSPRRRRFHPERPARTIPVRCLARGALTGPGTEWAIWSSASGLDRPRS